MDAILDACYSAWLFEIPNISRAKYVSTKHKYCITLQPILETDRVTHEELVELYCQRTHQVKPKTIYSDEDDALYNIYAIHAGQNPHFIQTWLKLFVDTRVGEDYLKSKWLSFELWQDSIKDG